MEIDRGNDLRAFRNFLDEKLPGGGSSLTLDEALGLWEYENVPDSERDEALVAIREGLEDLYAGRTRPARDVLAELRRKLEFPA